MTRTERAVALHKAGSACSQAVFAVFAEDLGLPESVAHRIAGGFGGGMGRQGLTCGAVTGGIMALSLALGGSASVDQDRKLELYGITRTFMEHMADFKGSTACRNLLEGVDLWTQEGRDAMAARGLADSVCNPMIERAVREVERILAQHCLLNTDHCSES
ncbi:MAG: C-GCAxxG-C-C family protein [Spirochaetaceae bacterium]|nr:C-GCAxxG-C-C family protein [Spirochaetaceae bacterium]